MEMLVLVFLSKIVNINSNSAFIISDIQVLEETAELNAAAATAFCSRVQDLLELSFCHTSFRKIDLCLSDRAALSRCKWFINRF